MSQAPAMPVFTDAIIGDTTHLTTEEFGAYCLLLFATWRNNGVPLVDDAKRLARVCRVTPARWEQKLRPVLAGFFDLAAGTWRQKRLEKEWDFVSKRSRVSRENGARGGRPKALENNETQNPTGSFQVTQSQSPHTHKEVREREEGKPSSPKKSPRGTRLPADYVIPDAWITDAIDARHKAGLPPCDVRTEAVKMVNHFVSSPGAKGVKVDWHRTWINWALNARAIGGPFVPRTSPVRPASGFGAGEARDDVSRRAILELMDADRRRPVAAYG